MFYGAPILYTNIQPEYQSTNETLLRRLSQPQGIRGSLNLQQTFVGMPFGQAQAVLLFYCQRWNLSTDSRLGFDAKIGSR